MFVFVAAQEFVALDCRDNADRALVARFRPLDASETAHPDRPGKSDLVWKGQENFDGRAFLHIFGQTSRDSVLVSPTAAPVVQRTVSGRRI